MSVEKLIRGFAIVLKGTRVIEEVMKGPPNVRSRMLIYSERMTAEEACTSRQEVKPVYILFSDSDEVE